MGKQVTVTLDSDMLVFIKETAHELKTQNNRHTDTPIFRIYEKKLVIAVEGAGEQYRRDDESAWDSLCDSCKTIMEESNGDWDKLPNQYDDDCLCDSDLFYWANEELVPADDGAYSGVAFLTEKVAQEYLEDNSYHFKNGVVYAESAFRNWELKNTIKLFEELGEQL